MNDLSAYVMVRNTVAAALDTAHANGFDHTANAGRVNAGTMASYSVVADALINLDEAGKARFGFETYVTAVGSATRAVGEVAA